MTRRLLISVGVLAWQFSTMPIGDDLRGKASSSSSQCRCGCGVQCRCCCQKPANPSPTPSGGQSLCRCPMKAIPTLQRMMTEPQRDVHVAVVVDEAHSPGEPPAELVRAIAHAPPSQLTHLATCVLLI